jgi:dephospho-CoA kinase
MFQVGVTGGIGSGKTLVCSVFNKIGIPVYDADSRARTLMNQEPGLVSEIRELLGPEAYREGSLNRKYVAGKVFTDPDLLNQLNGIVHPAVREDYLQWVREQAGVPYVIEEAAILFESGAHRFMDLTVLVYAPEDLRIRRVMERDGVSEGYVRVRMRRQMNEDEKRELADKMINNDETEMLLPQIIRLHQHIVNNK